MDQAERNGESNPTADICPDGDVILVVGPQKVRLGVYSQCLRCASKVFSAMFGPRWSEGQGLSTEYPPEILLEEDDADALRTICCVIHHRNDDVPQSLTPNEVLRIAIEADKYDLSIALKYASMQWLKPRDNADTTEMGFLLAAAFLFDDMEMFVAHSLTLILHFTGSYLAFLDDETISQTIPRKTFHLLEERRTKIRAELGQILIKGKDAGCTCGWGKNRSDKYTRILLDYGPLKMLEVPVSEIIKRMENFSMEDMEPRYHSGTRGYNHEAPKSSENFPIVMETMKRKAGICLDCVRSDDAAKPCMFQHN